MIRRLMFGSLTAALVGLVACGWDTVSPEATKSTPDAPCGNLGVPCLGMDGQLDGQCCWEGETCGGGKFSVGCPAGACCDIRQLPGAALGGQDGGDVAVVLHPTHSQFPASKR